MKKKTTLIILEKICISRQRPFPEKPPTTTGGTRPPSPSFSLYFNSLFSKFSAVLRSLNTPHEDSGGYFSTGITLTGTSFVRRSFTGGLRGDTNTTKFNTSPTKIPPLPNVAGLLPARLVVTDRSCSDHCNYSHDGVEYLMHRGLGTSLRIGGCTKLCPKILFPSRKRWGGGYGLEVVGGGNTSPSTSIPMVTAMAPFVRLLWK